MNAYETSEIESLRIEDSWGASVTDGLERSRRTAWIAASVMAVIAVLEAVALVLLLPLKTVEPYTLLVDRQTGNVEALSPLDAQLITPDAALTRSFLVQYVIARESYSADALQQDYRKVALWSEGDAQQRYMRQMQASNPASPLAYLPPRAVLSTQIQSVSSLSANTSLVRFTTQRTDPGGQPQEAQHWAAVLTYRFSGAEMSAEDRLLNPLGFQVTRYRRDAETLPDPAPPPPPVDLRRGRAPAQ